MLAVCCALLTSPLLSCRQCDSGWGSVDLAVGGIAVSVRPWDGYAPPSAALYGVCEHELALGCWLLTISNLLPAQHAMPVVECLVCRRG